MFNYQKTTVILQEFTVIELYNTTEQTVYIQRELGNTPNGNAWGPLSHVTEFIVPDWGDVVDKAGRKYQHG